MNALEIVGKYVEEEEIYGLQLKNYEEETSMKEIMNVRTEQLRTGEGIFTDSAQMMNSDLADRLNSEPNPERNGLILYFADRLMQICGGDESKYIAAVKHLYTLPSGIKAELPKPKPEGNQGLAIFGTREYQLLQKFISETMISGIRAFKAKHSSQETIDFKNLSLNLYVALIELKNAS